MAIKDQKLKKYKSMLLQIFPEIDQNKLPGQNMVRERCDKNDVFPYDNIILDNLIHLWILRINDIKKGDEKSRAALKELALKNFGDPNSDKLKFPFTFFLESENNLREIFREFISGTKKFDRNELWNIFLDQSKFVQRTAFEFFENVLQPIDL